MLLAALLAPLLAAQAGPPALQERARIEYVLVEVSARDREGLLVTDLGLGDFLLTENGKKIRIESLDILDLRGEGEAPAAPRPSPLPSSDDRRIGRSQVIVALDFEFTTYREARQTLDEMEKFLSGTVGRAHLEFLLYSLEGGALMDGFTEDPKQALRALADYKARYLERLQAGARRGPVDDRYSSTADLAEFERRLASCRFAADSAPNERSDYTFFWNCVQQELAAFLEVQNVRTETTLRELEALAERFQDRDSLKTVVFVSPGFSLNPGVAASQLAAGYAQLATGRITTGGAAEGSGVPGMDRPQMPAAPPSLRSFEGEFARVLDACARRQVVFHTFDLYNFGMASARQADPQFRDASPGHLAAYRAFVQERAGGMTELAEATGGAFHSGPTLAELGEVLEGTRFLYILGYTSPPGKQGAYRKIKVKCARKGVELTHRRGYFG